MTAPTITIDPIATDDTVNAQEAAVVSGVSISGTTDVPDTQTVTVNIFDNANSVVDSYITTPISGVWSVTVTQAQAQALIDGAYEVTADVSDTDATPAPEASVNLTIDTTPPAAPVIDPIGGLDNVVSSQPGDADVIGVTDLGTTVTLSEGSTVLGDATVDGSGNWSYTLTGADLIAIGQGGGKTFSATATDAPGNTSGVATSPSFAVDTVTTTPVILSAALTDNATPVISGTAEAGSAISVAVGGATYTTTATGISWSVDLGADTPTAGALALDTNGSNNVSVTAIDVVGNISTAGIQTLTIDTTPPAVPLILSADLSDDPTPVISGSADTGSTINVTVGSASYTTTATGGAWSVDLGVAAPISGTLSLDTNGSNVVSVTAADPAGNVSAAVTQTLTLDTTLPAAPVFLSASLTGNPTPVITGSAEAGSTISLTVGGASYTTVATGGAWSVDLGAAAPTSGTLSLNINGSNAVSVTATDPAGNISATGTQALTLDTTPPAVPVILSSALSDNPAPVISGSAEPGSTISLTVDGASYTTMASAGAWSVDLGVTVPTSGTLVLNTNGSNTVSVTATDAAGNISLAGAETLTIDTTPPATPVILSAALSDNPTPIISGSAAAGSTISVTVGGASYTTVATGGAWSVDLGAAIPTAGTLALQTNGSNNVSVTAMDAAGNISVAGTQTLTLDTTPPAAVATVTALSADTGTAGDFITTAATQIVSGTVSTTLGVGETVQVSINGGTTWLNAITVGTAWTASVTLSAGTGTLSVQTVDTAGNVAAGTGHSFTLATTAPAAPSAATLAPASDSGSKGDNITSVGLAVFTGTGVTGDTVSLLDGVTVIGTGTVIGGTWSITPFTALTEGSNSITATQTDIAGSVSAASAPLVVTLDTITPAAPPVPVLAPASDSGSKGDNITNVRLPVFTGTGGTGDTVNLFHGATKIGTGSVIGGNWSITATTALTEGANAITATQTDAAGNVSVASGPLAVTLDTAPPVAATVTALSADTGTADRTVTGALAAALGNGELVQISTDATTWADATVTGTAWSAGVTLPAGSGTLSVRTIDIAGNVTAGTGINFAAQADAPMVVSGDGGNVVGGNTSLTVTVSGAANTIQGGAGSSAVFSGGSGNVVIGGSGPLSVVDTGTNNTISGGSNATAVTTSGATQVVAGSGSLDFVGGTGVSTIFGGSGTASMIAGTGGVLFNAATSDGAQAGTTVNSGAGAVTIFGAAGASTALVGGHGQDFLVAGAGNETLNAGNSSSSNWLSVSSTVTSSSAMLLGGTGNDTLIGGSAGGSTTMSGGGGSNAFVFFSQAVGGARDLITDFAPADSVYIEGYAASGSAKALQSAAAINSAGLTLTLSDGTTITFANVTNPSVLNGKIQYG